MGSELITGAIALLSAGTQLFGGQKGASPPPLPAPPPPEARKDRASVRLGFSEDDTGDGAIGSSGDFNPRRSSGKALGNLGRSGLGL